MILFFFLVDDIPTNSVEMNESLRWCRCRLDISFWVVRELTSFRFFFSLRFLFSMKNNQNWRWQILVYNLWTVKTNTYEMVIVLNTKDFGPLSWIDSKRSSPSILFDLLWNEWCNYFTQISKVNNPNWKSKSIWYLVMMMFEFFFGHVRMTRTKISDHDVLPYFLQLYITNATKSIHKNIVNDESTLFHERTLYLTIRENDEKLRT